MDNLIYDLSVDVIHNIRVESSKTDKKMSDKETTYYIDKKTANYSMTPNFEEIISKLIFCLFTIWRECKKVFILQLCFVIIMVIFGCSTDLQKPIEYEYKDTDVIKEVIPFKYDYAYKFESGIAKVELDDKWGYIDKKGREVIPIKYDKISDFNEGLASVELNGKCGYVDKMGKEVIPLKYDSAWIFSDGLASVRLNGKYGYIDKTGREVIPFKYDSVGRFSEGLAPVDYNGKWRYIDKTGKEIILLEYDYAEPRSFKEGFASVALQVAFVSPQYEHVCIDKLGNEITQKRYDYISDFSEGLAAVGLNGKWGYIDKTGQEVIPLIYDFMAIPFHEGYAAVVLNGKKGFISYLSD